MLFLKLLQSKKKNFSACLRLGKKTWNDLVIQMQYVGDNIQYFLQQINFCLILTAIAMFDHQTAKIRFPNKDGNELED